MEFTSHGCHIRCSRSREAGLERRLTSIFARDDDIFGDGVNVAARIESLAAIEFDVPLPE